MDPVAVVEPVNTKIHALLVHAVTAGDGDAASAAKEPRMESLGEADVPCRRYEARQMRLRHQRPQRHGRT